MEKRKRIGLVVFLFGFYSVFVSVLCGYGREDTVRLVFRKYGSYKGRTSVYVVKKGDWLFDVLRRSGLERTDLRLVRRLNPHLKDLNRIYPGQKILLPVRSVAKAGLIRGRYEESGYHKDMLGEAVTRPWSASDVDLIAGILKRFDISISTAGYTYIPLPDGGHVTVDCSSIPRIDFEDGSTVFMDYNGRLPKNIRELIEKGWPNYRVLQPAREENALVFLSRILGVTRSYEMDRVKGSLTVGDRVCLQFSGDWIIRRKAPSDKPHTQIIVNVASEENLLPLAFHEYGRRKGILITEVMKGRIIDRPSYVYPSSLEIPGLKGNSAREVIVELLKRLGYPVFQDVPLHLFDNGRDGFRLFFKAELMTEKENMRIIISSKPIQGSLEELLRMHSIIVVSFKEEESTGSRIEKVLCALDESYTDAYYSLPVTTAASPGHLRVILPCIRILKKGAGPIYLVDFDLDPVIYDYLHKKMGLTILRY